MCICAFALSQLDFEKWQESSLLAHMLLPPDAVSRPHVLLPPPTTTNYMVFGPMFAREGCPTFKNRQHMRTKDKHMRTHRLTQLRERQRTGKDTQLHWEMHGSLGERQRMG